MSYDRKQGEDETCFTLISAVGPDTTKLACAHVTGTDGTTRNPRNEILYRQLRDIAEYRNDPEYLLSVASLISNAAGDLEELDILMREVTRIVSRESGNTLYRRFTENIMGTASYVGTKSYYVLNTLSEVARTKIAEQLNVPPIGLSTGTTAGAAAAAATPATLVAPQLMVGAINDGFLINMAGPLMFNMQQLSYLFTLYINLSINTSINQTSPDTYNITVSALFNSRGNEQYFTSSEKTYYMALFNEIKLRNLFASQSIQFGYVPLFTQNRAQASTSINNLVINNEIGTQQLQSVSVLIPRGALGSNPSIDNCKTFNIAPNINDNGGWEPPTSLDSATAHHNADKRFMNVAADTIRQNHKNLLFLLAAYNGKSGFNNVTFNSIQGTTRESVDYRIILAKLLEMYIIMIHNATIIFTHALLRHIWSKFIMSENTARKFAHNTMHLLRNIFIQQLNNDSFLEDSLGAMNVQKEGDIVKVSNPSRLVDVFMANVSAVRPILPYGFVLAGTSRQSGRPDNGFVFDAFPIMESRMHPRDVKYYVCPPMDGAREGEEDYITHGVIPVAQTTFTTLPMMQQHYANPATIRTYKGILARVGADFRTYADMGVTRIESIDKILQDYDSKKFVPFEYFEVVTTTIRNHIEVVARDEAGVNTPKVSNNLNTHRKNVEKTALSRNMQKFIVDLYGEINTQLYKTVHYMVSSTARYAQRLSDYAFEDLTKYYLRYYRLKTKSYIMARNFYQAARILVRAVIHKIYITAPRDDPTRQICERFMRYLAVIDRQYYDRAKEETDSKLKKILMKLYDIGLMQKYDEMVLSTSLYQARSLGKIIEERVLSGKESLLVLAASYGTMSKDHYYTIDIMSLMKRMFKYVRDPAKKNTNGMDGVLAIIRSHLNEIKRHKNRTNMSPLRALYYYVITAGKGKDTLISASKSILSRMGRSKSNEMTIMDLIQKLRSHEPITDFNVGISRAMATSSSKILIDSIAPPTGAVSRSQVVVPVLRIDKLLREMQRTRKNSNVPMTPMNAVMFMMTSLNDFINVENMPYRENLTDQHSRDGLYVRKLSLDDRVLIMSVLNTVCEPYSSTAALTNNNANGAIRIGTELTLTTGQRHIWASTIKAATATYYRSV